MWAQILVGLLQVAPQILAVVLDSTKQVEPLSTSGGGAVQKEMVEKVIEGGIDAANEAAGPAGSMSDQEKQAIMRFTSSAIDATVDAKNKLGIFSEGR